MKLIFAVAICIFAFGASAGAQQSSSEKKARKPKLATSLSDARRPFTDERARRKRDGLFPNCYSAPFLIKNQRRCHLKSTILRTLTG